MKLISSILADFESISLSEAKEFSLTDRNDKKFIFSYKYLNDILIKSQKFYKVMQVNGNPQSEYKSLYFDTKDLKFYHNHHNGKKNRYKIRYRKYLDTEDCFLEVKFKTNKKKTIKSRIPQKDILKSIPKESSEFLNNCTPYNHNDLISLFYSTFKRTTLIHKEKKERVTIDINLKFYNGEFSDEFKNLVIAEVKTERFASQSDFIKILKEFNIYSSPMSKYCTGLAIYKPTLKQNRFKKRFLNIKKITDDS